jgi:hypothetical protein
LATAPTSGSVSAGGRTISCACTSCRTWRRANKVKTVVTNDVLFHEPGRRQLQDVVTCIRTAHHRRGRLRARTACRPLSEAAGGNGAPVSRAIPRRWPERWRSSTAASFARRADLPISRGSDHSRVDGAGVAGALPLGMHSRSDIPKACRPTSSRQSGTSST